MLRSHAALCVSTGSLEMSVFQTLLAGNIGQLPSVAAGPLARREPALPVSGADVSGADVSGADAVSADRPAPCSLAVTPAVA